MHFRVYLSLKLTTPKAFLTFELVKVKFHLFPFFLAIIFAPALGFSQEGKVVGVLRDASAKPIDVASIAVKEYPGIGTTTNEKGEFTLTIPVGKQLTLLFSHISFKDYSESVQVETGEQKRVAIILIPKTHTYSEVEIEAEQSAASTMKKIDPKIVSELPSASGNFEAVLFSELGVSSNNELSSQYSVRGGNFDENLVYVNDILIYRPFLVRSGQQEGLSFINSELTQSVSFSAGGFEARYGDKLSSVLDITYKEPRAFAGSASLSFLGASAHIEEVSKDYRLTQIHGIRYRTNQYLLGALDTDGNYRPSFFDYQTYLTYDINEKFQLDFLGNISQNNYRFVPETRTTDFGTIQQALRFTVFFDGQEQDKYTTYLGALSANYRPNTKTNLKFISSLFRTFEVEAFDIRGQYRLDDLETDLGDEDFGEARANRGIGGFLDHARNNLDALVFSTEHKGKYYGEKHTLLWGLKYQYEDIVDEINEWQLKDSSGFSLPHPPDSVGYKNPEIQPDYTLELSEVLRAQNITQSSRILGYFQDDFSFESDSGSVWDLSAGTRFNYWDFNNELLISPRFSIGVKPNWNKEFSFRFATGLYQQPAFYREMRDFNGQINRDIKAQSSIHFLLGGDRMLEIWNRPFKLTAEMYYKYMYNLIPYEVDNVRVRYYATNNAKGDAKGIDVKINGEFVKGVESWASLSVMQVREDILDDFYMEYYNDNGDTITPITIDQVAIDSQRFEPGFIPRPTDQRINFGLYFQDYIPNHPNYKVHMNLLFGTGLPTGPPNSERYQHTIRIPAYRRVDIGFSAQLLKDDKKLRKNELFKQFNTLWASLEVFNLLQINNTISYLWVKDLNNQSHAIPNYLTARRVNLKIICRF